MESDYEDCFSDEGDNENSSFIGNNYSSLPSKGSSEIGIYQIID